MLNMRNPNESAYIGGQKHWTDVIKNSGPAKALIWRQPEEDFNTNSTLIVMPGEEAIFINGGVIEQTFSNGTYKLSTENYPFISRLRNAFSGGVSVFNCVVYFVKTAHTMELLWGTTSPIQVRDKLLGIATKLRARGAYKIQISDPGKFLTKLVGGNEKFMGQQELVDDFFARDFQKSIRKNITHYLNETETELLGIEDRIEEIAESISPSIAESFDEYGIKLVKFSIAAIDVIDDELRRKYDEIGMENIGRLRTAQAQKGVMDILGEDWGRQQSAEILHTMAANPGAGGAAAMAGAGIGMGMATGGAFANMAQQMVQAPTQNPSPTPAPAEDPMETLSKLKKMLDGGLITQEAYDKKMNEVLARM
ncbi:MAG: SPFH domain-containing protein [Clostridiales bacterium]|nr:SPFH domain-containing protein [Clostridiales bacterium]